MVDYKKALEEFTYIVSHDLNAPLRHVREFGKLLIKKLGDKVNDEEREYLEFMEGGIYKAEAMIAGLLEYSRLHTDAAPYSEFDCGALVDEVINLLNDVIEKTQANINISSLPNTLTADKIQIHQLFFKLIDNALSFRRENVTPRINIMVLEQDDAWLFSVADNGIGIPDKQYENIFKMFKRLDPVDSFSSIGSGLTIAKEIVERHEGEIWVESELDKGTTAFFTIPKN